MKIKLEIDLPINKNEDKHKVLQAYFASNPSARRVENFRIIEGKEEKLPLLDGKIEEPKKKRSPRKSKK